MKVEDFNNALEVIKNAWESLNPSLLSDVLADDVVYHEDPNERPLTSIKAVVERWKKDLKTHSNVSLKYQIMETEEDSCIAEWSAEWEDSVRGHRSLRGVYYLRLDESHKLREFRQWWL